MLLFDMFHTSEESKLCVVKQIDTTKLTLREREAAAKDLSLSFYWPIVTYVLYVPSKWQQITAPPTLITDGHKPFRDCTNPASVPIIQKY
eukprot:4908007-Amphidinium_carterae.1